MAQVSVADAKAQLSALIDRVEAGESIQITRRGKPVACLSAAAMPRKPVDIAALRALTDSMAPQGISATDFVRAMRDSDRY